MRAPITDAPAVGCGVGGPKSGAHSGCAIFAGEPLELAAADVLEVAPRGIRRGLFIEIDGHLEPLSHGGRRLLRQRHALGHRDAFDRDERHDVDGAEARMLAGVRPQVDRRRCRLEQREHGGLERRRFAGQRQHRSVVRGIGRVVEHAHARHAAHGVDDAPRRPRDAVPR